MSPCQRLEVEGGGRRLGLEGWPNSDAGNFCCIHVTLPKTFITNWRYLDANIRGYDRPYIHPPVRPFIPHQTSAV